MTITICVTTHNIHVHLLMKQVICSREGLTGKYRSKVVTTYITKQAALLSTDTTHYRIENQ